MAVTNRLFALKRRLRARRVIRFCVMAIFRNGDVYVRNSYTDATKRVDPRTLGR